MTQPDILQIIAKYGIVPVITIESVDAAIPLADALLAGGLPLVEITFRTAAAADVIRRITAERPELLVGAGTVLTEQHLKLAVDCGARFGVAPGLNPQIVRLAQQVGLPFVPGVATPSDIEQGMSLGCQVLKFFPAEALGGLAMLQALAAPYAHTGVRFMPTGGVNLGNLRSYLAVPQVAAVGGTWLAKKEDLAAGRWQEIRDCCAEAIQVVSKLRGR